MENFVEVTFSVVLTEGENLGIGGKLLIRHLIR